MSNKIQEMSVLLELKQFLAWEYYDSLNLKALEPLRLEVQTRIDKLGEAST